MSTELATLKQTLTSDAMRQQFAAALPKHLSPERFIRIAITALTRTPKLAECTQASLMRCLLDLSALGLEPDGRRAHLIPRGKECTLLVDYKGIVELVRRDPSVLDVQCITICEKDECEWINGEMIHKINPKQPRGEVVSTYTRIVWENKSVSVGEPFSRDDAERARRSSASANSGPWKEHYVEMWKKSNIRRDSKMWPLTPEIREAIEREDEYNTVRDVTPTAARVPLFPAKEQEQAAPETTPEPASITAQELRDRLKKAKVDEQAFLASAEKGGLFLDASVPLDDQPVDVLVDLDRLFDEIVKGAKP